jgi:aromatic-L-amino-acid/L-tryptophan decarboxylase
MTPEEFRVAGHALVDWVADLRSGMETLPVQAQVSPGDVRRSLPTIPPAPGSVDTVGDILADLDRIILPGTTHLQHPNFFGYFPANHTLSSVLGDIVSGGIGALGITWISNPALTEVEEVMCDWLRQLVGLSEGWKGSIHDSASSACLVAMICAREQAGRYSFQTGGTQGVDRPMVIYSSPQAHSSVLKAALLAGFGRDNVRMVAVDPVTYAMRADSLRSEIEADLVAGRIPAGIVAAVGTTGTTAIDPVAEVVAIARSVAVETPIWVHVDAAMAGSAMLLPECRVHWDGVEGADSISWNPHKWMGAALDCSMFLVRDTEHLIRCMSSNPSYLRSAVDDDVTSYKDWGIPLGRRFRALKVWFQLRLDGIESIQNRLRRDIENARWLEAEVLLASASGWKVLAPVPFQTVCVRHEPTEIVGDDAAPRAALDAHTLRWCAAINDSGAAFLTPSILDGQWMVRVSIGAEPTERRHVQRVWALMQEEANNHEH